MNPEQRFPLYRCLGDPSLFLTGVFPEAVVRRPADYFAASLRGPRRALEGYLEIGPEFYRRAAACPEAVRARLEGVLTTLGENFALARKPLTLLAQRYLVFDRYLWFGLEGKGQS